MIHIILSLLFLNYIPKEFQQLRRKAIRSSQIKLLSDEKPEPMILPGVPFITDSFIGTATNPIFGITNKELKGFAISKTTNHIAIIADRESQNGRSILEKNSIFFGMGNVSVSLTEKFADDGEVAIFNITHIDPLAAFYSFDMKLSVLSYDCKAELGKGFGARCFASFNESWDHVNNKPKELDLEKFNIMPEIREKVKIYAGAKAYGEASAIIEKRGASLQAKFDGSLKVLAGAGFHIDQVNYTSPNDQIKYSFGPLDFGEGSVDILGIPVSLKVSFITTLSIIDLSFVIPHEVEISRLISIDIYKGYTISTKHGVSPDYRKEVKVGKIHTDSEEKGNSIEQESLQADFSATFTIRPAILVELTVGSTVGFSAEVGPEVGIEVNLGIDKEKCTFPGLYGTFTPFVNTTCIFGGSLKIANLQLVKFTIPISKRIYEKVLYSGCFFDGSSSKELEKDFIQVERNRKILYIDDPKFNDKSLMLYPEAQPFFFVGESDQEKPFYLGVANIFLKDDDIINRDYIYIPEYINIHNITILPLQTSNTEQIYVDYPFEKEFINSKIANFSLLSINSKAIDMGNEIKFNSIDDIKNFRTKFIQSTIKSQPIGLILHSKSDGYFNDENKYFFADEVNDETDQNIVSWAKIEIAEITGPENVFVYFQRKLIDEIFMLNGLNGYIVEEENKPMESTYIETDYKVKILPQYLNSHVVCQFLFTNEKTETLAHINITKGDLFKTAPFSKEFGSFKVTFKCTTNVDDVEYVAKLKNIVINESSNDPLKGIICRIFQRQNDNYEPEYYKGNNVPVPLTMMENEIYGILRFYMKDLGYDIKNNKNLYAFICLPQAIPLLDSAVNVDEKEDYYAIKLEYGKSIFGTSETGDYIINIPFRRRKITKITITATLYRVYQSYDNKNEDSNDPYCPSFPSFTMKPIENFFVGCIHSYLNGEDFSDNRWKAYSKSDYKFKQFNLPSDKSHSDGKPFNLLYIFSNESPIKNRKEETINVFAMREYFNFPEESRTMIIENETIENLKTYAPGKDLQIICDRCEKIYINQYPGNEWIARNGNTFSKSVDDIDKEFALEAVCKSSNDAYCIFDYDIRNNGVVLLEFNSHKDDGFDVDDYRVKSILNDQNVPTTYPGVEEIYNVEEDKDEQLAQSRFNINCRRQVIPSRNSTVYLSKPWKGDIKKIGVNLEQQNLNIKIAQKDSNGYIHIFMLAEGLSTNKLESIPFNPNILAKVHDVDIKRDLKQIGINIETKTIEKALDDKDLIIDNNGNIQIKKEFFNEDMLKNSINSNYITLIGIPYGQYKLTYVKCEIRSKKKKCSGTVTEKDKNYDDEVCVDPMSNFEVKTAYLGVSTVFDDLKLSYKFMKKARKVLGHLIPSPNFLHTGIWVGPNEATNETEGAILTYGDYHSAGKDPTFISNDGARAYKMTLKEFKETFDESKIKKLSVQRNMTLFNIIDEIKSSGKWEAKQYSWAFNNCQHFTKLCLNILNSKRSLPKDDDWIDLPKIVLNALESNEGK